MNNNLKTLRTIHGAMLKNSDCMLSECSLKQAALFLTLHPYRSIAQAVAEAMESCCNDVIYIEDNSLVLRSFDGCSGTTEERKFATNGVLVYSYYDCCEAGYGYEYQYDTNGELLCSEEWGE